MTRASENPFPHVTGVEQASTPSTPASGRRLIYPKDDGWYDLDDAGTETALGSGASIEGFRATLSADQSLSAATHTKIVFDTEDVDQGADYDPATGIWTVPETAWYVLYGSLNFVSPADGERFLVSLYRGGSLDIRLADISAAAASDPVVSGTAVPRYLASGSQMAIYAWRENAGDISSLGTTTMFSAVKIGTP